MTDDLRVLNSGLYDERGELIEPLLVWNMEEITVDGIYSSYENPVTGVRRTVMQPMISAKFDEDSGPGMRWVPDYEVDEERWIRTGKICHKA